MSPANFRLLRLARESRRLSQAKLAVEAGISQAIISRIESGLRPASDAELERLAGALAYPTQFFVEPDAPAAAPLFRKRAIRSVSVSRMIQARVNTAVLAARRILDAGVEVDAPFALPEPGEVADVDPTEASHMLRQAWRLPSGRLDNVTETIEAAGGIVLHVDFGSDDASAACVYMLGDPRVWFLVNTREKAGDRVRLSLAHELGHAVMHRYLAVQDESRLEPDAYKFAVALTLPPEDFNRSVSEELTLRAARDLKRTYWISMQAIVRAASDRGLISKHRYTSLYKQLSARGWRREEPEPIPVEQPNVWPSGLSVHRRQHGYSDQDLADIARLSLTDLQDLFPTSFERSLRLVGHSSTATRQPQVKPFEPHLV